MIRISCKPLDGSARRYCMPAVHGHNPGYPSFLTLQSMSTGINIFVHGPFRSKAARRRERPATSRILNTFMTSAPSANRARSSCGTSDASNSPHIVSKIALSSILSIVSPPVSSLSSLCRSGSELVNKLAATASCSWSPSVCHHLSMSTEEAPSWRWRSEAASYGAHCHLPLLHMTAISA